MKEKLKELLNELEKIMEEKRQLNVKLSELKSREADIEQEILNMLDSTGLDEVKIDNKRIGRTQNIYFNITDWDAFLKWCRRRNIFPLQKRPQTSFLREFYEQKNKLPDGIEPYVKEGLSIRTIRG